MTLKSDAKYEEKPICCFKNDNSLVNFDRSTQKVSKVCALIGSYCAKCWMFKLKKYRGVIFHDTEERCKIWRKTELWFGKWHEKFSRFLQSMRKCKNWYFDGILLSKVENLFELKIYRGVMCHDSEEWYKYWRGIDLSF